MSFYSSKNWKNRDVEFPGRRTLTNILTATSETVDVTRSEGTITEAGDAFDASNMNDLEGRIGSAFLLVDGAKFDNPTNSPTNGQIIKYSSGSVIWADESGGGGGSTFNDYLNVTVLRGDWESLGDPSPVPGASYKNEIIISELEEGVSLVNIIPSAEMVEEGVLYPIVGIEDNTLVLYATAIPAANYTIPIVSVRTINEVI